MSLQRVCFNGKKYFQHPVFSNYAASKTGEVINVETEKILKMLDNGNGYNYFKIYDKKTFKTKKLLYQHSFVWESIKGVIPEEFEVDHINTVRLDNRIKNLQLLTHLQNVEKSKYKPIISINIETSEEKIYISVKSASNELNINLRNISAICRKEKHRKTARSKNNGDRYTFQGAKKASFTACHSGKL